MAKARRLICEGESDNRFFEELIECRGLQHFVVQPIPRREGGGTYGGRTNYGRRLKGLIGSPEAAESSAFIIVGDNDSDPVASFGIITAQIGLGSSPSDDYVYGIPSRPLEIVPSRGLPDVCVLMLPWERNPGALETLCYISATACNPHIATCVDAFVTGVGADRWAISNRSKLQIQCYLSGLCEQFPNTQLTQAWSSDRPLPLIPVTHSCFDELAAFLAAFPVTS